MKASIVPVALVLLAGGCTPNGEPEPVDRRSLHVVTLPDLSRLEESVQTQLAERYAVLAAKRDDPATPQADLATEYGEMGTLLLAADFRDAAEASLLDAQTLASEDMRWPYYLGHLYRASGDIPKATAAFEQALRVSPGDGPTMIWLAESALDQGRPEVAESLFLKALSREPDSAAANYGLGRAALARRDYAHAAQYLERALTLDDKASIVHYSLAMAYRGLGDEQRAEAHLRRRGTLQIKPDPLRRALDTLLHSALTYEKNADAAGRRGEWSAAVDYLEEAVALAPTRASVHHKLGTALFYVGRKREALGHFHEALKLSPSFAAAHYAIGVMHEESAEHQQAIDSFSAAVTSAPFDVDARLALADALRRSGRLEASLPEYERVLDIDASRARARFGYAAALLRLQRYRDARTWLDDAMVRYPEEPSFARLAARLFAAAPDDRVRDGPRAVRIAEALLKSQPQTIELAETMGMASAEVSQYGEAVRWQREAMTAADRAGRRDLAERMATNLERYQSGQPARTPWREDEPIEF